MFVILLTYTQPIEKIDACLVEHRQFLDRHYASGHLIASGPQVPRTGGVILARGLSRSDLEALLAQDPFQREQVATYEIIEFEPVKKAAGLENLFS